MVADPNTIGLMLLFLVIFLACILWATSGTASGHIAPHDKDIQFPEKPS